MHTADPARAQITAPAMRWQHGVAATRHSHDGQEHAHGADAGDALPLGEPGQSSEAGEGAQVLSAVPWPPALPWVAVRGSQRFEVDAGCRSSGRHGADSCPSRHRGRSARRLRSLPRPVSALFGNFNRGGVLALATGRGGEDTAMDSSGGSFATVDVQGAMGAKLGGGHFNGAFQGYRTEGFRPGFRYKRGTLGGRRTVDVGPRTELSLSGRVRSGDWDSVGNVTDAQFRRVNGADPFGQDLRVVADGGLQRYTSARVD